MTVTKSTEVSSIQTPPITPPRVLHIITALGTGGAERQLQSLVRYSGAESSTIALYDGGMVADAMRETGESVLELDVGSYRGLRKLRQFGRLVKMIKAQAPDVVHVHLLAAQLWGIPAARLAGVRRIVSSEHSLMDTTIENRPLTTVLRSVYRVLEKLSSHTIAVSPTTRDRLLKWDVPASRITVVNNGIDFAALAFSVDARRAVRKEWQVPDDAVIVGAVGRLEPVKRFPELLTAIASWLQEGSRRLVIVGTGPLHDELLLQAGALGIADQVLLLGARNDIPAILSGFDVLVSASQDETFGMAVIEAMGAGLPVVYAQCPALDDLETVAPGVFPLAGHHADPTGGTVIAQAVEAALERTASSACSDTAPEPSDLRRWPVPEDILHAYGIESAAAAVDSVYGGVSR